MLSKILTRAGNLGAVHALLAGLDLQSRHLLVGDMLEGSCEQVHPMRQVVVAQTLSEVI
jgi:hypothetical protein